MAKQLTLDQKIKIYSKFKTGTKTVQLAKDFHVSRQTISAVVNSDKFGELASDNIVKIVNRQKASIVDRLEGIKEKLITKFENSLDEEDDIRKLTDLYKNISHDINIIKGNPTEIKEKRVIHVDMKVIANLSPEKQILYLNNQIPVEELQNE